MAEIQIVAKESHQPLANISGTSAKLQEPSIVLLKVSPQDISTLKREGTSVIVYLKNGEVIKIENFFSETEVTDNSLVLGAGTDQLIWARFTSDDGVILNVVQYQPLSSMDDLLYSAEGPNLLYWAALPVAVGAGYIIHDNNKKDSSEPEADHTKPTDPINLSVSGDGKNVTGHAEAGAIVIVRDANGKLVGSGTVNSKGEFDIKLDKPLTNGEILKVTIKDAAGNISGEVKINAPDTTKPSDPTDIKIEFDGSKVTGKGEAGAEVIIKDKDGKVLGKAKVNDKGEFEVKFDPALNAGQDIKVSIKDPADNESADVAAKVPPNQPTITDFDGQQLSGTADAGTEIKVYVNGKVVGTGMVDHSGNYSFKLIEKFSDGETIVVKALDDQGNESKTLERQAPDTTAPKAPVMEFDGTVLQGKTEAGAKVVIKSPTGEEKTVYAGTDGHFKITLDTPLNIGDSIDLTVADKNGNTSDVIKVLAEEPPKEPEEPPVDPEEPPVETETPPTDLEQASASRSQMSDESQDLASIVENDLLQLLNTVEEFTVNNSTIVAEQEAIELSALFNTAETTTELDDLLQDLPLGVETTAQIAAERTHDLIMKSEIVINQEMLNPLQDLLQQHELQF